MKRMQAAIQDTERGLAVAIAGLYDSAVTDAAEASVKWRPNINLRSPLSVTLEAEVASNLAARGTRRIPNHCKGSAECHRQASQCP
jgi:hypothetical protein